MTCQSIYLKSKKDNNLEEISKYLTDFVNESNSTTFQLLNEKKQFDQINILNFVIEKRYARISSSVILTIQIIETSDEYYVSIISTAANVLFDFGSIVHFMTLILTVFKELGFEEV